MKINLNSLSKDVPDWFAPVASNAKTMEKIPFHVKRMNLTAASKVTDTVIDTECDFIDSIAKSDQKYCINDSWDDASKSHLKEYALASGFSQDRIVIFDPKNIVEKIAKDKESIVKTASTQEQEKTVPLFDPFHIDENLNKESISSDNWEEVKKAQMLGDKPSMEGINPIRGGEVTTVNSDKETFADYFENKIASEEEDTGVRLRREREERETSKRQEQQDEWSSKVAQADKDLKGYSQGSVFVTESMNAQPGLAHSNIGVFKEDNVDQIPDKTAGEQIKEANEVRRKSIQGEKKEDKSWDNLESQNSRTISDTFAEALKKNLK